MNMRVFCFFFFLAVLIRCLFLFAQWSQPPVFSGNIALSTVHPSFFGARVLRLLEMRMGLLWMMALRQARMPQTVLVAPVAGPTLAKRRALRMARGSLLIRPGCRVRKEV